MNKDLFGFEELERKFIQMQKAWPNEVSRTLKASARLVATRTKQLTNKGKLRKTRSGDMSSPGSLKRSWRVGSERYYVSNGYVTRFVRVFSTAPHAHLVNLGHKLWVGGQGKGVPTRISFGGKTFNVKNPLSHPKGTVDGQFMVNRAKKEFMGRYGDDIANVFDKLTKDVQI